VSKLESKIQNEIELALGALPGVLLLRNNCGVATFPDRAGRPRKVRYGLGEGSPDLVLILAPGGNVVALEVKRPGERPEPAQERCHAAWRTFGAHVEVVHSVEEARAALENARNHSRIRKS
jgi:hypothetical protein